MPDLKKFAAIGFPRKGRYMPNSRKAHRRQHFYSAGLFNVALFAEKRVNFDPRIKIWEDIEFTQRASAKHNLVVVRSMRFMQQKTNFRKGGCTFVRSRFNEEEDDESYK